MSESVYQGDTVELEYAIENRSLNVNWQCVVNVKQAIDAPVLIDLNLSLNALESAFTGLLDTSPLVPGRYFVYAELSNVATSERTELHHSLLVRKQGVVPS